MHSGFRKFKQCWSYDEIDIKYDDIQLKSTGDDDVCITELYINNQKILTGPKSDRQSFWMQKDINECTGKENQIVTNVLTIRNMVLTSDCYGLLDCFGLLRLLSFVTMK